MGYIEMFRELIEGFNALEKTTLAFYRDSESAFRRLIPSLEATALSSLIENVEDAMDQTVEYRADRAAQLREHLLLNLSDYRGEHPVHIEIYEDGTVFYLDEDYLGTEADFEEASYGSNDPRRFAFWKYGIYIPSVEGGDSFIPGAPEYEDVISRRLDIWGTKAPYWLFIENGNQGGGEYPSFAGTDVFRQFGLALKEAVRSFHRSFVDFYEFRATEAIERSLERRQIQKPEPDEITWVRTRTTRTHHVWQPKKGDKFLKGVIRQAIE